ncbi:MAG: FtsW/RodA/SpoVE family cell cycle protein, partial [Candidatus Sungbacteria bacterium]|nr:FtsW/RodA/SpoVE family cell cycle protein [Candidatus Sungbacteria bacterium]
MRTFSKIDQPLLFIIMALLLLGLFTLASASVVISEKNFGTPYGYALRQILYAVGFGTLALFIFQAIPYHFWKRVALSLLFVSLFLLVL